MRDVVIVDFARTAFSKRGGALRFLSGAQIGARCLTALVSKSGIWEKGGPEAVDSVIAGSIFLSKDAYTPVRYMTQLAGFPLAMEGHRVDMQDGSALASINQAAAQIALGYADTVIAGAMESYSTCPVFLSSRIEPYQGNAPVWLDLKQSPFAEQNLSPEEANERLAAAWKISREDCGEYAAESRLRLKEAFRSEHIGAEVVPISAPASLKKNEIPVEKDDFPEPGLKEDSAVLSDGAGFFLLMTPEKAAELGYTPIARWITGADIGTEPALRGIAPAYSALKALKRAGLGVKDISDWENSELFAAENLAVMKAIKEETGTGIDRALWNPNGGALGLGYPGAASGAQMLMFALMQMEKTGGRYASVSAACGGGLGVTVLLENLRV